MELWPQPHRRTQHGRDRAPFPPIGTAIGALGPATTGRMLVLTDVARSKSGASTPSSIKRARQSVLDTLGVSVVHSSDLGKDADVGDFLSAEVKPDQGMMLDDLGVVVVESQEDYQPLLAAASADSNSAVRYAEEERVVWALNDYLAGFQEGVNSLADSLRATGSVVAPAPSAAQLPAGSFADDASFTWGLKAVGAVGSTDLGLGARVAVLDTGVDANHPDLVHALSPDRIRSFVNGEDANDLHGHGTHCAGTIAGRKNPVDGPRYGVAPETELWIGKVLGNNGSGGDAGILAGIQWAIQQGCHVVSMSLGAGVSPSTPFSQIFETVARTALERNTIIVAAAGNSSNRPNTVNPIGHPANCPSIVAVAALDQSLTPAFFSDAGRVGVDHIAIGGPGVDVLSAAPGGGTATMSGTSMATPHVAGVAAAIQGREQVEGAALTMRLMLEAEGLVSPAVDVGLGLSSVGQ